MREFNRRRSRVAGVVLLFVLSRGVVVFAQTSTAFEQAYQTGAPVALNGTLSVSVADEFAKRRAETVYTVREAKTGRAFTLRFAHTPARRLRSGDRVTVAGRAHGSQLYVYADQTQLYAQTDGSGALNASATTATASVTNGDQRTLVMLVNFSDTTVTCTPDAVSDLMFSSTSGNSVDALYRQSSSGTVSVSGEVAGPFTIQATSTDPCDTTGWADAADAAAAASGHNPASFPRRLYVLPSSSCPAAGIGDLGGASTRAWVFTCGLADVYAHELGHNLGMNHASTPTNEYGDYSDFMGLGLGRPRQVNGVHKLQMGWLATADVPRITQDGSYDVTPLELQPDGSLPQLLKIDSGDSAGAFFLSYRRPIGVDADLCCSYVERLNVHRWADGGARSYLVATLGDGESYTDPASGFSVQQVSHDALAATTHVHVGTSCSAAPTVTLAPRDQSGAAGSEAVYDVNLANNDGASCAASQFSVAGVVPAGWSSVVSQSSVQLAPGTSTQLSWTVSSAAAAGAGSYPVSLGTSDTHTNLHSASTAGTYTVIPSCIAAPGVTLSPSSQTAVAGATLTYSIVVTNRDGAGCPTTTFAVAPTLPTGWSAIIVGTSLTLSPGANGTSTLSVTSPGNASPGTYGIWANVSGGANPIHNGTSSGSYIVPPADTVAPTAPGGTIATVRRKQVAVSWQRATDNVAVAGYRVIRNGAVIASTTATSWIDAAPVGGVPNTYSIVAFDAAGNASPPSNTATVTIGGGKK